jgi:uncharacterized membrane protein
MTDNLFIEQLVDYIVLAIEVIAIIFITGIVIYFLFMFSKLSIVVTIRILLSWSLSKDFELYEKRDSVDPKAAL